MPNICKSFLHIVIIAALAVPAAAAPVTITVPIEGTNKVSSAVGLILSPNQVIQVPRTVVETDSSINGVHVSFEYEQEELPLDGVASALIQHEDGFQKLANVQPLPSGEADFSFSSIPVCVPEPAPLAYASQLATIERVVENRSRRFFNRREVLTQLLDDEMLLKLRKFERGFGLEKPEELTRNLPPLKLADRVARILYALETYQAQRTE